MAPSGLSGAGVHRAWTGATGLTASSLTGLTRWLSAGATLAAVVEHGYQELHVRGSFDPEVMSVVYLINSIGKPNTHQASLIAWVNDLWQASYPARAARAGISCTQHGQCNHNHAGKGQ